MSTTTIRDVLESRLITWAANQAPALPIAFENVQFTKPSDGRSFLQCFLIPNTTLNNELSGKRHTHIGLFQVNVWTKAGIGMALSTAIADGVAALYPIVPKTASVSIEATPTIGRAISDPAGWQIQSVLIRYRYEYVAV